MEFKPSLIVYRTRTRKLFSTDLPQYLSHLLRLDADSRRKRFGSPVSDAFLAQYAQRCFVGETVVYAYVEGGQVRGAAEFIPYDSGNSRHAEAAFSVESGWRRQGIGSALFERLVVTAGNRQIARLVMHCMPDNKAMQRLALRFKADVRIDGDEGAGVLVSLRPTLLGMAQEVSDDFRAFIAALASLQVRIWGVPFDADNARMAQSPSPV